MPVELCRQLLELRELFETQIEFFNWDVRLQLRLLFFFLEVKS